MMLLLSLLQAAALNASPPAETGKDIVVLGISLKESEQQWHQCRQRRCPPDEEIKAALVHAENLFVAGSYARARSVLSTTTNDTRQDAERYPVAVGDLRRASARIAAHMGENDDARRGMVASREALKQGLGADDAQTLAQRLLIGDSMMLGGLKPMQQGSNLFFRDARQDALQTYDKVARDAHRKGFADIEARALLRTASLLSTLAAVQPWSYEHRARAAIRRITGNPDPRLSAFKDAALMLDARLDIARGDVGAVDKLVSVYRGPPTRQPVLLYAPPIDWGASRDRNTSLQRAAIAQNGAEGADSGHVDQWIDVGFRVGADGRVKDVDVLRQSREQTTDWVGPVLAQIRGRRYAPLAVAPASIGALRVERHTYTAAWGAATGGRIRQQTGTPQVVVTDLTVDADVAENAQPHPATGAPEISTGGPSASATTPDGHLGVHG